MSKWHYYYYPDYKPDLNYYINGPRREPPKFNGKGDFSSWECDVCDILGYEDVAEALDGKPESMKEKDWKVFDAKACSILRFYLSDEVQNKVVSEKTSKDILEKLERIYLKKESFIERISLKMQLYRMKMDESVNSLSEHLVEFNRRLDELSDFDVELSEDDKVSILLVSLPEKYNDLVMGMLYAKDSVVCHEVEQMLLFHENRNAAARNQNRNGEAKTQTGVNKEQGFCGVAVSSSGVNKDQGFCGVVVSPSGSSKSKTKKVVECHYCHEIGHVLNHCPKLELKKSGVYKDEGFCGVVVSPSGSSRSKTKKEVECHYCHEIGHVLNHCPKLDLKKSGVYKDEGFCGVAVSSSGVNKDQGFCGVVVSPSGSSRSKTKKVVECHYCHEIGHVLNHCPKLELKKAGNMNF